MKENSNLLITQILIILFEHPLQIIQINIAFSGLIKCFERFHHLLVHLPLIDFLGHEQEEFIVFAIAVVVVVYFGDHFLDGCVGLVLAD